MQLLFDETFPYSMYQNVYEGNICGTVKTSVVCNLDEIEFQHHFQHYYPAVQYGMNAVFCCRIVPCCADTRI